MNFGFTDEQELLRQEVRKVLDAQAPMAEVRRLAETPEGFSRELWKQMGELGWLGLTIPEAHGGAGLGWVDLVVLLEEAGRSLLPSPLIATTLAAATIADAGSALQQARWLPRLADGTAIGSVAVLEAGDRLDPAGIQMRGAPVGDGWQLGGEKRAVLDGAAADLLVVAFRTGDGAEDIALALVERGAAGLRIESTPSLDATQRVARVHFDAVAVLPDAVLGTPGRAAPVLARLLDRGAVAVTAEAVGAAEQAVRLTVEYAKQRVQFGSPIGRFQGVKHPLAEMYVDVESFRSLLYYAAWCLDEGDAETTRAVSMAKAYASEAFSRIGIDGVQLHGGVGYTWEYDIQLYLKRSKWVRPTFGDADFHYDRIARIRTEAA
ncbi:acyl-CoA dehydrogenase family protein [Myxococcota bacterium]|nr:acyl-CoA dehydrogenase family protein [Myxococcota bacterium]MCZ7620634.1 acyl-CoA dehydrogenase [Myxococcota bacterium]